MEQTFNFYIQRYPTADEPNPPIVDVQREFNCIYVRFQNIAERGQVKNVYFEKYAEAPGSRVWVPDPEYRAFEATEATLTLYFNALTALADADRFADYVMGRKIEYFDNFRNLMATLVCQKRPEVQGEKLYGGKRYKKVSYTFTNVLGAPYTKSKIRR